MTDTIGDVLARVDALDKAATKGPWSDGGDDLVEQPEIISGVGSLIAKVTHECVKPRVEVEANRDLIAESRTLLPAMARALRVAAEGLDRLKNCHRSQDATDTQNAADDLLDAIEAALNEVGGEN